MLGLRGQIEHKARAQQLIDYSGMVFGKITPTDIDGLIEYHGKAFIYYEFKYLGAEMKPGQRIALERAVESHRRAGKHAIAVVVEHDVHDCDSEVPAAQCAVREYYVGSVCGWKKPEQPETALGLTQRFLKRVDCYS